MRFALLGTAAGLALLVLSGAFAQQPGRRAVAITVDDLPYAPGHPFSSDLSGEVAAARAVNRRLLAAFRDRKVPVTGFVIGERAQSLGPAGVEILTRWTHDGFDLGNHTWSHPDMNDLSIAQIEGEIMRGDAVIRPLMEGAGRKVAFFRFPMNETGNTKPKHDAIAEFLPSRGYASAPCTIDTSDYIFNAAYVEMLARKDVASARKLRGEYIAYSDSEIDYYARLNTQVLGYEPPEVMLLHDNRLNADVIGDLLKLFETKHYRFISLAASQSDAAYRAPSTYITKYGWMWGYRWAKERGITVDGSLEPDPPKWIAEYDKPAKR
ncbi:MAG TPA: polysaccharide deacetylase family protein [Bryobacteraceae bacterium]|nr:polysaccharide deacetylase family protein [Bryobacteraceae bacterium]